MKEKELRITAMAEQISIDQMIACVEREIGMRQRVYPRWVEQKKMLQATADQELARMRAVLQYLSSRKDAGVAPQMNSES